MTSDVIGVVYIGIDKMCKILQIRTRNYALILCTSYKTHRSYVITLLGFKLKCSE